MPLTRVEIHARGSDEWDPGKAVPSRAVILGDV